MAALHRALRLSGAAIHGALRATDSPLPDAPEAPPPPPVCLDPIRITSGVRVATPRTITRVVRVR